jgi:hypothetical protein
VETLLDDIPDPHVEIDQLYDLLLLPEDQAYLIFNNNDDRTLELLISPHTNPTLPKPAVPKLLVCAGNPGPQVVSRV